MSRKLTGSFTGVLSPKITGLLSPEESLDGVLGTTGTVIGEVRNPSEVYVYDYRRLVNKPSINDVVLYDNKTFAELGATDLTNSELEEIFDW